MDLNRNNIKSLIVQNKRGEFVELLHSGLDPNLDGGWPIRLAARYGCYPIVKSLLQFGANPHLLGESGASTLQLAVFSGDHWDTDEWTFLMSCCDSSQLADGAAVAVIFQNNAALKKILETGRCNTNIPTTLTGKTVDQLAKGYKMSHLLNVPVIQHPQNSSPAGAQRQSRQNRAYIGATATPHPAHRNLSPSVARFFNQTAGQTALTSPRRVVDATSPITEMLPLSLT